MDYLRTQEISIFLKAAQTYREPKEKISKISDKAEKKKERPKCESTMHALFFTAILGAMRSGELLGLQWGDIGWANQKMHVRRSLYKGGFQSPKSEYSKRAIDMGPRLIQVLKEHRAKQNETRLKVGSSWANNEIVFCENDGSPLDADNLYHRDFKAILKKAELRAIWIHDLRHTFASILIAAGHNLKYIQNQMGHSKIEVTFNLYGHLLQETLESAAQKTESLVFAFCPAPVPTKKEGVTESTATPQINYGSGG